MDIIFKNSFEKTAGVSSQTLSKILANRINKIKNPNFNAVKDALNPKNKNPYMTYQTIDHKALRKDLLNMDKVSPKKIEKKIDQIRSKNFYGRLESHDTLANANPDRVSRADRSSTRSAHKAAISAVQDLFPKPYTLKIKKD